MHPAATSKPGDLGACGKIEIFFARWLAPELWEGNDENMARTSRLALFLAGIAASIGVLIIGMMVSMS